MVLPAALLTSLDLFCSKKLVFQKFSNFGTLQNYFCSVGGSGACNLAGWMFFPGSSIHFQLIISVKYVDSSVYHSAFRARVWTARAVSRC